MTRRNGTGRAMNAGRKDDSAKLRFDLIPDELDQVVAALTFGAQKYGDDNWRRVPNAGRRYLAAALRHLWLYKRGERNDAESGLPHLGHAGACILFLLALSSEKPNASPR